MSKFSGSNATTKRTAPAAPAFGTGPLKTKAKAPVARTHEGGTGYVKGDKSALFTLAVTNMVGEPTFYESGKDRDDRFRTLVRTVAAHDPEWIAAFIPFLRDVANMRSASIVVAVEAAVVFNELRAQGQDVDVSVRRVIDSACSRADEPAELLGYFLANYGRKVPMGIKRGIGDAFTRLVNEYSAMKYDGDSRNVRMGDVIELVHPRPAAGWQSALFKHLLDKRHGHVSAISEELVKTTANAALLAAPMDQRRALLAEKGPQGLADAGMTWERLSGWLPGGMDAEAWEAIIPNMGYMALLRNLRNFQEADVSRPVLNKVRSKLADPEEVAKSRQFPYRFWSAYKNSGGVFFAQAIEDALDLSCQNIPELPGKTFVFIDTSGSMQSPVSGRSDIECYEAGALFGAAVAAKNKGTQVFAYGTNWEPVKVEVSILRTVENVRKRIGKVGHGTNTWPSVMGAIAKFGMPDRILIFTDGQDHPNRSVSHANVYRYSGGEQGEVGVTGRIPDSIPIYSWDLSGYATANVNTNTPGQYLLGGFSDATFKLVPLLEAGATAAWPWES